MMEEAGHRHADCLSVRLYLIRHGETEWSRSGRHTGRTDLALTSNGEDQARSLAPMLRSVDFARVFTSSALRARSTCDLVGLADADIEPDLAEWDYGDYEGRLSADICKERPDWSAYRDGCPGGESAQQVAARADRLIGRLRQLDGNVALFSHGQFGCSLGARWIGMPVASGQHLQLDAASFGILAFNPTHPGLPVISLWNVSPRALGVIWSKSSSSSGGYGATVSP